MIDIACDACGKRYRIDEAKMKTETAKVKCKTCGHVITVTQPQPAGGGIRPSARAGRSRRPGTAAPAAVHCGCAPGTGAALRDLRHRSPTG